MIEGGAAAGVEPQHPLVAKPPERQFTKSNIRKVRLPSPRGQAQRGERISPLLRHPDSLALHAAIRLTVCRASTRPIPAGGRAFVCKRADDAVCHSGA